MLVCFSVPQLVNTISGGVACSRPATWARAIAEPALGHSPDPCLLDGFAVAVQHACTHRLHALRRYLRRGVVVEVDEFVCAVHCQNIRSGSRLSLLQQLRQCLEFPVQQPCSVHMVLAVQTPSPALPRHTPAERRRPRPAFVYIGANSTGSRCGSHFQMDTLRARRSGSGVVSPKARSMRLQSNLVGWEDANFAALVSASDMHHSHGSDFFLQTADHEACAEFHQINRCLRLGMSANLDDFALRAPDLPAACPARVPGRIRRLYISSLAATRWPHSYLGILGSIMLPSLEATACCFRPVPVPCLSCPPGTPVPPCRCRKCSIAARKCRCWSRSLCRLSSPEFLLCLCLERFRHCAPFLWNAPFVRSRTAVRR